MLLTDEQRDTCTKNHNLIYSFLTKRGLDMEDIEDWYGAAACGLCKAVATYNPKLGYAFSSYAFRCMYNESLMVQRKKLIDCTSIDALMFASDGDNELTILDTLADVRSMEDYAIITTTMFDVYETLTDKQKEVVSIKFKYGLSDTDVAEKLGVSRSYTNKVVNQYLHKLREALN